MNGYPDTLRPGDHLRLVEDFYQRGAADFCNTIDPERNLNRPANWVIHSCRCSPNRGFDT